MSIIHRSIIDHATSSLAKHYIKARADQEYKIEDLENHIKNNKIIPFDLKKSINDRKIIKIETENILIKLLKDFFTFNNNKEIKYLMSIGYSRTESKNIIAEICKLNGSADDIVKAIKDYPSKEQTLQGYTSKSEHYEKLKDAISHIEILGYTKKDNLLDSLFYLQLFTSKKDFVDIVYNIPTRNDYIDGYTTR